MPPRAAPQPAHAAAAAAEAASPTPPSVSAFAPLRHPAFRLLWAANLVSNIGGWVQNTAAAWTMAVLDGSPLMVGLVQAATLLPVFLLALPAGALADIVDRRRFLIAAQIWMCASALLLAALSASGALGPWGLLALTFALGVGSAVNFPAWAATTPELVPREDLPGAIVLNGIGFNLSRALGPALGGLVLAWSGPAAAFAANAACFVVLIVALLAWRRPPGPQRRLPDERLGPAMRAGVRFVAASPPMRGATLRGGAFFFFGAAIWGLLPLLVRDQLRLGPEAFGAMLAAMGAGAVGAGLFLPRARAALSRSDLVVASTALGGAAFVALGLATHWAVAGGAMLAFGAAWIGGASTLTASAQLSAPPWVRARAMGLFQVATFGAMALGSALAGLAAGIVGLPLALGGAGVAWALAAWATRGLPLEAVPFVAAPRRPRLFRRRPAPPEVVPEQAGPPPAGQAPPTYASPPAGGAFAARDGGGGPAASPPAMAAARVLGPASPPSPSRSEGRPSPAADDAEDAPVPMPTPADPAPELAPLLGPDSGRVMEAVRYTVAPADRAAFLDAMRECRAVRLRSGAVAWRLYEDVARPERFVELWVVESWTDHLREEGRLTEEDTAVLAAAAALHGAPDGGPPEAARYLGLDP